jgi:hypothetical protein
MSLRPIPQSASMSVTLFLRCCAIAAAREEEEEEVEDGMEECEDIRMEGMRPKVASECKDTAAAAASASVTANSAVVSSKLLR